MEMVGERWGSGRGERGGGGGVLRRFGRRISRWGVWEIGRIIVQGSVVVKDGKEKDRRRE